MLSAREISRSFTSETKTVTVLRTLNLTVTEGEFFVILGQSGCGKSTLLRILGGFDTPDSGTVLLDEKPVTAPGKDMVMMFQSFDQLFPWFTLQSNITYALKKTGVERNPQAARIIAMQCLQSVGLGDCGDSYPHQLSGGMKQRAALARALALRPRVLLMDEPFSSLDYLTRKNAQRTLHQLWQSTGMAVVLVTHDIEEAVTLGQRIAVLGHTSHCIEQIFENDGSADNLKGTLERMLTGDQSPL
ncbi:MAG: ATP-binding cassette domain-containing protein [Angelakisella sp.]